MKKIFASIIMLATLSVSAQELYSEVIPKPFYEVQSAEKGQENKLTILESGIASLYERLELIKSAKKNIEVEYFIYGLDESSKLLTLELVKAAKRGVKVRVLIDASVAVLELEDHYAAELIAAGVELKHYNTASIIRVSSIQFRNHRKLLSVDDKIAITGGRNIGNDYFDVSTHYNFLDRDVIVEGPIVKTIRESFDEYFNHKISRDPKIPRRPKDFIFRRKASSGSVLKQRVSNRKRVRKYLEKKAIAKAFLTETEETSELRDKVYSLGKSIADTQKTHSCPELTYSTDLPGGNFFSRIKDNYTEKYRGLRKTLYDKISTVNKRIILSSPYMLNNKHSRAMLSMLQSKDVDITIYTNSLASTDAIYVAANLYDKVFNWVDDGIKVYLHAGAYIPETDVISEDITKTAWGTHSKTQLYERVLENGKLEREIMIGTYNIDNRSNYYNNEMAIFCKGNPELAQELEDKINGRIQESYELQKSRTAIDKNGAEVSIYGVDESKLRKMKWMSIPAKLLKFLM